MIPDAATAVISAAIEDAIRRGHDPATAARRAVHALERDGWTITARTTPTARQTPTQHAA